jgi:hypothetical protein
MTLSDSARHIFEEIADVVIENRIAETSIILIPSGCIGQRKSQLQKVH